MAAIPASPQADTIFNNQENEMKHFHITIDDSSYDVEILNDPRQDEVQVKVNGETFTVRAEDLSPSSAIAGLASVKTVGASTATPVSVASAQPSTAGPGTIKSPLPGVINSIKAQTGQKVKPNDELCVIEAMKAMNVIRATREGTVARIYICVGGQIAYGAPLMDIE
jgi:biotin carboxyl carrier protein